MTTESCALRLELRMDAAIPLVSVTRRFVEAALEKFVTDPDLVARVAMTAHELLENAAKYAQQSKAELSVVMNQNQETGRRSLTLQLSNVASPGHVDRLRQSFTELDAC